jgi:hypothetical protein
MDGLRKENRSLKKEIEEKNNLCDQMSRMMESYENKVNGF